ncbi:hypothetical protein ACIPXV_10590 [Streptomyces libani]|uniref:hypothetical protein n=1 Tax=Streptomyces nigrescens TaxID=1920 RepID=UPI003801C122
MPPPRPTPRSTSRPSRPPRPHRRQRHFADRLHHRADTLRAAAAADVDDPGLNIRDAVDLAAVQLGLHAPTAD